MVVAEVSKLWRCLHPLRAWPLDFAGAKTCGQLPFEDRRLAGVARIHPVNVPARLENEMHTGLQIPAEGHGFLM